MIQIRNKANPTPIAMSILLRRMRLTPIINKDGAPPPQEGRGRNLWCGEDTDTQKNVSLSMKSTEGGHPLISTIATKQSPIHMQNWLGSSSCSLITSVIESLFTATEDRSAYTSGCAHTVSTKKRILRGNNSFLSVVVIVEMKQVKVCETCDECITSRGN